MSTPFSSSIRGYARDEVDKVINEQEAELSILRQINKRLTAESAGLRSDVNDLRKKVKSGANMGYADLGSQFESTLRLAEEQARKLLQDAGLEAIKIRDTATAEGDRAIRKSEKLAEKLMAQAEVEVAKSMKQLEETQASIQSIAEQGEQSAAANAAQAQMEVAMLLARAHEEITQLKVNAQQDLDGVRRETDAVKREAVRVQKGADAKVVAAQEEISELFAELEERREEAEAAHREVLSNIAVKANELELLNRKHQQSIVDFELELAERRTQAEVESAAQFQRSLEQIRLNNLKAEEILAQANERARERTTRAEEILRESEDKAAEISESSHSNAFHLLAEARRRSEILTRKSEGYSLLAISDAENRLAKMQSEYEDLTEFIDSLKSMMSTDAILAAVESTSLIISAKEASRESERFSYNLDRKKSGLASAQASSDSDQASPNSSDQGDVLELGSGQDNSEDSEDSENDDQDKN